MRTSKRNMRRRAFTLLEVLMVIVILGILSAVIGSQVWGSGEQAKKRIAEQAVSTGFNGAIDLYRLHMNRLPESLEELLNKPDSEEDAKKWGGPYIKSEQLKDPWGNEWHYEKDDGGEVGYVFGSKGKDGSWGSDDDITNKTSN